MKKFLALALALSMALGLCACSGSSSTTTTSESASGSTATSTTSGDGKAYDKLNLKLSYATGDTGMDGIDAIKFEELVEERSGGAIQVDRFPNCQLSGGDMVRHVEMMVSGGAFEMAIISQNSFSTLNKGFYASSIPFAFANYQEAYDKIDSTGGEYVAKLYDELGIVYLSSCSNGIMQFANNKHEVRTPADMKNLKMRTYGDLQMSLMRDMGADPTQLSWSELYSALQTGAVDGNMNGYQTLYSGSMHEVQPYITEVNVTWACYDMLYSKAAWEKLSPDTQELIRECAVEAAQYARDEMDRQEGECKQAMIDYGVSVYVPTEEEMAEFKEAATPTIESYKEMVGAEGCEAFGIE